MLWGKDPAKRTKFGRFLDEHGIYQEDFAKASGLSRYVVSKLCNDHSYIPRYDQYVLIKMGLERLGMKNIKYDDYWK